MSNKIVNPLIQYHTSDTLNYASEAMVYLWESMNELEFTEVSFEAQQGLCSLIQCVCQAINYEAGRTHNEEIGGDEALVDSEKVSLHTQLSPFERELVVKLYEGLRKEGDGVVSLSDFPGPRKR